jgi:hypothetical protein
MNAELNRTDEGHGTADRDWLAAWLLREGQGIVPRMAVHYRRIAALPHSWRRRMRRTLAVSLSSAALLLALAGPVGPSLVRAEGDATDATITVVNGEVAIANNGKCSLMEAIINARATSAGQMKADCRAGNVSGPDTVSLPSGGLFELTAAHNSQHGPTGLPVITTDMTIEGNGATIRRSAAPGTPQFRILDVDPGVTFVLRNTTISNGWSENGGGIYSQGTLVVEGSTISDNTGYYVGGGIAAFWGQAVIVTDSVITGNTGYLGGGIAANTLTISGSQVVNNTADGDYGGQGGGIRASYLVMTDTTVSGNTAVGREEDSGYSARGGGVLVVEEGTISGSTIADNVVTAGEDGYSLGEPVDGTGGGIFTNGDLTITNSTISGNRGNAGGGVFVGVYGQLTAVQTTITGNTAQEELFYYQEPPFISYGGEGGGIKVVGNGSVSLSGVILSGNTADNEGQELYTLAFNPSVVQTNAFNVLGRNGDLGGGGLVAGATDIVPTVDINAILLPLADNGGPTQTHALSFNSPALDVAPNESCLVAPVNGVDQRGEPRNANGRGGASSNECDAGSFELQPASTNGGFLISATGSGKIDNVTFTGGDILKYVPVKGWTMYFDASDVGVTRNLSAFEVLPGGDILMSFGGTQNIPGVGKFLPQDIARFTPTATGPNTAGAFSWALDGSANGLTTSSEKIDALGDIGDGRIAISTTGTASVKLPNGATLKAADEDALGFNLTTGRWSAYFDGTAIPGLKPEDINALWIDTATGDLYISMMDAFNLSGVRGNASDIVKLTPSSAPGGYTPSLWWDGSAEGFKAKVDGVELLP